MKSIGAVFIIFLSVLLMGNNYSKKSLDNLLKQFRWEKRVLLLVTHSNGTKLVKKVDAFFGNNKCQNKNRNITFTEAINEAITLSMSDDKKLICFGLGIDDPKSIFNTTKGIPIF